MEITTEIGIEDNNGTKMLSTSFIENMDFVNAWFLMGSPIPVTLILASYLLFVLKIGPEYMKSREPYKFQNIMLLYNAAQVLMSCFLVYLCINLLGTHGLVPKTCVMETDYTRKSMATAMHYYLLAKISELLDTIFFVLRKKENQVSFLHVYHHTLMVFVTWTALKYEPTYTLIFLGILNSFVHVIMYTYYGLSSFPNLAQYLWWKKYITSLQLVQFVLIIIHFGVASVTSECSPSYIMSVAMATNIALFLYLFGSFYVRTYKKTSNKTKSSINNGTEYDIDDNDKEKYKNRTKLSNGYAKIDNETSCTRASITVNDTYRIRFNLEPKKLVLS